ncbi:hypothetical protein GQ53DRAFT_82986 [Thozetella sp. PMI_491]|nr:hypothetical protein GQ53DRAFT_82986 [Thozetella sp. PMI_491]
MTFTVRWSLIPAMKSRLLRTALSARALRSCTRSSSSSRHMTTTWKVVSGAFPHRKRGEGASGTLWWCRKAWRPIFPVLIWQIVEAMCFATPA